VRNCITNTTGGPDIETIYVTSIEQDDT